MAIHCRAVKNSLRGTVWDCGAEITNVGDITIRIVLNRRDVSGQDHLLHASFRTQMDSWKADPNKPYHIVGRERGPHYTKILEQKI